MLWYLSSFIGVACVYLVFQTARKRARFSEPSHLAGQPRSERIPHIAEFVEALVVAALVLPIELLHDLVRGPIGMSLVGALTLLVVAAVVWISSRRKVPLAAVSKKTGTNA